MKEIGEKDLLPLIDFVINAKELEVTLYYLNETIYLLHYLHEGTVAKENLLNICFMLHDLRESLYEIQRNLKGEDPLKDFRKSEIE